MVSVSEDLPLLTTFQNYFHRQSKIKSVQVEFLLTIAPSYVPLQIHPNSASTSYDMNRVNLLFLVCLVWTSLSAADDYTDYDYIGEDEDTYDVSNDVEESSEALSSEGKQCLLNLINDCLVENEGSAEACEWLTKQLEVSPVLLFLKKTLIFSFRVSLTMMSRTFATCPGCLRLPKPISRPKRSLT